MLDQRDMQILDFLQTDADMPVHVIAERIHISPSACSRRIARLREDGYIQRTVALLDRLRLNLRTTVFVIVRAKHSEAWLERFRALVQSVPEILECHRLAGNFDYLFKVVVQDVESYDAVYKRLVSALELDDVSAYISMETLKDEIALPLAGPH